MTDTTKQAEPVAWCAKTTLDCFACLSVKKETTEAMMWPNDILTPLYTHPAPAPAPSGEPVAWRIKWDNDEWMCTLEQSDFDIACKEHWPIFPLYPASKQNATTVGMCHSFYSVVIDGLKAELKAAHPAPAMTAEFKAELLEALTVGLDNTNWLSHCSDVASDILEVSKEEKQIRTVIEKLSKLEVTK